MELSKRVFKVIVAVFLLKPIHKGVQAIMVVILWFKSRNWRHEVCQWLRCHGRCRRTCRQIRACWRCQIVMNNGCKPTRSWRYCWIPWAASIQLGSMAFMHRKCSRHHLIDLFDVARRVHDSSVVLFLHLVCPNANRLGIELDMNILSGLWMFCNIAKWIRTARSAAPFVVDGLLMHHVGVFSCAQ